MNKWGSQHLQQNSLRIQFKCGKFTFSAAIFHKAHTHTHIYTHGSDALEQCKYTSKYKHMRAT